MPCQNARRLRMAMSAPASRPRLSVQLDKACAAMTTPATLTAIADEDAVPVMNGDAQQAGVEPSAAQDVERHGGAIDPRARGHVLLEQPILRRMPRRAVLLREACPMADHLL